MINWLEKLVEDILKISYKLKENKRNRDDIAEKHREDDSYESIKNIQTIKLQTSAF